MEWKQEEGELGDVGAVSGRGQRSGGLCNNAEVSFHPKSNGRPQKDLAGASDGYDCL